MKRGAGEKAPFCDIAGAEVVLEVKRVPREADSSQKLSSLLGQGCHWASDLISRPNPAFTQTFLRE